MIAPSWTPFFAAAAGAAATLAGLVVVAVSVNLQRILLHPALPPRAAAAVGALVCVLAVAMAALAPQGERAFALEATGLALAAWATSLWAAYRIVVAAPKRPWREIAAGILVGQAMTGPLVVGAALTLAESPAGLPWLAAGTVAAFIGAMLYCWVLLVEILR